MLGGVLLAFAVDSYGQNREDAERVARMLTAVGAELEVNATRLSGRIAADEQEVSDIDSLFVTVTLVPEASAASVTGSDVTRMTQRVGPKVLEPYQTGALDDLVLSGGLNLIRDQVLRQAILNYSQRMSEERAAQENGVDFWNDHLSPYYFEHGNIAQFLVGEGLGLQTPPPDVGAFVRSREFANLLGERRAIVNRLRIARETLMEEIDSLRLLLGARAPA